MNDGPKKLIQPFTQLYDRFGWHKRESNGIDIGSELFYIHSRWPLYKRIHYGQRSTSHLIRRPSGTGYTYHNIDGKPAAQFFTNSRHSMYEWYVGGLFIGRSTSETEAPDKYQAAVEAWKKTFPHIDETGQWNMEEWVRAARRAGVSEI